MTLFYYIGLQFYSLLIRFYSLFNKKARQFVKGRKGVFSKIANEINPEQPVVWFHCASLGEFEQGRPLIEKVKKEHPAYQILLSFFSPSGYEVRKNYEIADSVIYLPMDGLKNARKFYRLVNPDKIFFVKYEFWYFYLKEAQKNDIPVYLVSAIFREDQVFFRPYGKWYRNILKYFTHIFVQNENSKRILMENNITNVSISGDTRFDRVREIAAGTSKIPLAKEFVGDKKVLIAGSTWKKDEELLIHYMEETDLDLKMIIAPHEVHESNIQRLVRAFTRKNVICFSEADLETVNEADVLIIDSVGMLSSLYQYGTIAYIGGGFGKGIHNILEPATFGLPVFFGPNYQKFKEAVDLIKLGGAFSINQYSYLMKKLTYLMKDPNQIDEIKNIVKSYIEKNSGSVSYVTGKTFSSTDK
jgi:3-deoxy-D-manno-octulosonic-acid transferase